MLRRRTSAPPDFGRQGDAGWIIEGQAGAGDEAVEGVGPVLQALEPVADEGLERSMAVTDCGSPEASFRGAVGPEQVILAPSLRTTGMTVAEERRGALDWSAGRVQFVMARLRSLNLTVVAPQTASTGQG